ncbi:toll/interleukin-1 receptor domain-containing protein [Acidithiobacillus sp.]|uniref:toll/interleukin-1 receptor domain-containing protein n=1 Tax=Acidithiobacillus sp. TaxID=1872118 RepID=UPI003CFDD086
MPIAIDTIRSAAGQIRKSAQRTLYEAKASNLATAFLCHSHEDADLAKGVVNLLANESWGVYVDWEDSSMPATPDRQTAQRIQQKIIDLKYFIFLASPNSVRSRWCPWEIGYADGKKNPDQILIIPTSDRSGAWYGSEYLQLYRRIDEASQGGLAVWRPGQTSGGAWVRTL